MLGAYGVLDGLISEDLQTKRHFLVNNPVADFAELTWRVRLIRENIG